MEERSPPIITKVLVPKRRPNLLYRPRLVDFIHDHIDRKLILISASAGYGKTSLLIDYAHDTPDYDCGWAEDCQNFVSQVLNAGGVPEVGWWRWNYTHWFFDSCSWYANSWTVNSWFDDHATYWTNRYQSGWWRRQRADSALFRFPDCPDWCHAAIYMGWGIAQEGSKTGQWIELRSQHSPDRCRVWWWEDVPNGTYLILWHVIY